MSIFRTSTPAYRGQTAPAQPSRTLGEWLRSLFHVATPRYQTKPVSTPPCEPQQPTDDVDPPVLSQPDSCD